MLQKAIIEQKIDKYSMKVRIPVYNKIKSDPTATPTNELYTAIIQTLPGCSPNYLEGDVVLVDFENDNISYPVIIGLLFRENMSEGSTDITADSLKVNVNTDLSENTLIGSVTPEAIKKLNDKYANNVKSVLVEYSLSNYEDHYESFTQWSEQAPQYWPGKYMWQRTTVTYENDTATRSMTCIQGAKGDPGSSITITETYVKYAVSSSGTTHPSTSAQSTWYNNPPATTDPNPYLWSWTYVLYSDGTSTDTFNVSRTSPSSLIVYLYKRSNIVISQIDWQTNLIYNFDTKQFTSLPTGWSSSIPSGNDPIYVTAATASSVESTCTITPAEWSSPILFTKSGFNSKTVQIYKRGTTVPSVPSSSVTYTFSDGSISPASPDGWSIAVPTTNGNPCYVTQATAISYDDTDTILTSEWSAPSILAQDGSSDYIDQDVVDWYIATNTTTVPITPTVDIEVSTEWTTLGWTNDISSITLSTTNKYLWNAEVTHYSISGYVKTNPHIITIYAESGRGITTITEYYAINDSATTPPDLGSSDWQTTPVTPTSTNRYLWSYDVISYTTGNPTSTTPRVISMYAADGTAGSNSATVFLYQRAASSASLTKPQTDLTYTFSTGVLSGTLGSWTQTIPATDGNPCFSIQATAIGVGLTDTITSSEWSNITKILEDGEPGTPGAPGTNGLNNALVYLYKRSSTVATIDWSTTLTYDFVNKALTSTPTGWTETIPSGTDPIYVTAATASSNTSTDTIAYTEWATPVVLAQNGQDGSPGTNGKNTAVVYLYKRSSSAASIDWSTTLTYSFITNSLTIVPTGWTEGVPSGTDPLYMTAATASSSTTTDTIEYTEWATPVIIAQNGQNGSAGANTATVFLYQRAASSSALTKPQTDLTYTFATGVLSGTLGNWSQSIPATDGNPCFVIQATAVGTGATDTIGPAEWSNIIKLVADGEDGDPGTNGVSITAVINYYLATNESSGVTRSTPGWTTAVQSVSDLAKYLWNYEEITYSSGSPTYTDPCIIGSYGDDGSAGVGISSITEYYALSTNTTRPSSGWSTTLPTMDAVNRYLWNYSVITYTDGTSSGTQADALIIGVYGESTLSLEIESDNGTLFNSKTLSTTLSPSVYLGISQLTVNVDGTVVSGSTTIGQINWFARERFIGNGVAATYDLGLDILNYSTSPDIEVKIDNVVTSAYTVVDENTITFTTAPADESIVIITYLTSDNRDLVINRTDVRNQVLITCKLVSGMSILGIAETTVKDLNDARSVQSWYMLTVDDILAGTLPTVIYDPLDYTVTPSGEYQHEVSGSTVTETFMWQNTSPVVSTSTVNRTCYSFQMIIFEDNSCSAGTVQRDSSYDSAVNNYLQAITATDAANQAQNSANAAQSTADNAMDGVHANAEDIQNVQQTLTAVNGVLAAKLDTVTFSPYQENIDAFMQFDVANSTMTLGQGNFKQQLSATKNSFLEGSTEVAYISNQELYINNATINQKLTLDEQWIITFDSNGLTVKHI